MKERQTNPANEKLTSKVTEKTEQMGQGSKISLILILRE